MMGIFIHSLIYSIFAFVFHCSCNNLHCLLRLLCLPCLHCRQDSERVMVMATIKTGRMNKKKQKKKTKLPVSSRRISRYGFPEILMGWLRSGAASLMCQEFVYIHCTLGTCGARGEERDEHGLGFSKQRRLGGWWYYNPLIVDFGVCTCVHGEI